MTMVYLANVKTLETPWGIECFTPHAHLSIDFPIDKQPCYMVLTHFGSGKSRGFDRFDQAMDYASRCLKQSEPA